MEISRDNLLDVARNLDYDSLLNLCSTNKEYKNLCKDADFQQVLQAKRREYRPTKAEFMQIINNLNADTQALVDRVLTDKVVRVQFPDVNVVIRVKDGDILVEQNIGIEKLVEDLDNTFSDRMVSEAPVQYKLSPEELFIYLKQLYLGGNPILRRYEKRVQDLIDKSLVDIIDLDKTVEFNTPDDWDFPHVIKLYRTGDVLYISETGVDMDDIYINMFGFGNDSRSIVSKTDFKIITKMSLKPGTRALDVIENKGFRSGFYDLRNLLQSLIE